LGRITPQIVHTIASHVNLYFWFEVLNDHATTNYSE